MKILYSSAEWFMFLKLYKNTEKLNEFSENGKKIVKKYYTKESFIGQYRELYEELGD